MENRFGVDLSSSDSLDLTPSHIQSNVGNALLNTLSDQMQEPLMQDFYIKFLHAKSDGVLKVNSSQVRILKESGISLQQFLNYIGKKYAILFHGSSQIIHNGDLKSHSGKIFLSQNSEIAIMKSLYSNRGVSLKYPYFFTEEAPFSLTIYLPNHMVYSPYEKGYIYLVKQVSCINDPVGSWQYISHQDQIQSFAIVETVLEDFTSPVEFVQK